MKHQVTAIIPAAGKGSRMSSLTEKFPKAMLPISNEKLTIDCIIENLIDNDITKIIIVGGYHKERLFDYVKSKYISYKNLDIACVEQTNINGLPGAIRSGLEHMDSSDKYRYDDVFIVLGDTILSEKLSFGYKSWIGYKTLDEYRRWCLIKTDRWNRIENFIDKPQVKPPTSKVIIGAYYFTNRILLSTAIAEIESRGKFNNEYQFADVMTFYLKYEPIYGKKINEWYDVGEISTFKNSKKNIARCFNDINIDNDIVEKRSDDTTKLFNEIEWYNQLPKELSKYVPGIYDNGYRDKQGFYRMDRIKLDMLQEIFIYGLGNNDSTLWDRILNKIFKMLSEMKTCSLELKSKEEHQFKLDNDKMFIDKTISRVNMLLDSTNFDWKTILNSDLIINGVKNKSFISLKDKILKKLKTISNNYSYGIIHGDLFFGNMFYDIVSDTLKLIDPRGSWGSLTIYGDTRYDLAKLNQSIMRKWDFIVNEFYILNYNEDKFDYEYFDGDYQKIVQDKFLNMLKKYGYDAEEIDFLTGITFLCSVPLHSENLRNQIMQYLTAIQIFNKYL